jgi:hypothetical protein
MRWYIANASYFWSSDSDGSERLVRIQVPLMVLFQVLLGFV